MEEDQRRADFYECFDSQDEMPSLYKNIHKVIIDGKMPGASEKEKREKIIEIVDNYEKDKMEVVHETDEYLRNG